MNPLTSILGTIVSGFILSVVIVFALGTSSVNVLEIEVWFHVLAGVVWIGLLYYFNFVQVPAVGQALAEANLFVGRPVCNLTRSTTVVSNFAAATLLEGPSCFFLLAAIVAYNVCTRHVALRHTKTFQVSDHGLPSPQCALFLATHWNEKQTDWNFTIPFIF